MNVMLPAIILSILAGLFARMEGDKAVVLVINNDSGILGSYMTESLVKEKLYDVQLETLATEQSSKDKVKDGKADASVIFQLILRRKCWMVSSLRQLCIG